MVNVLRHARTIFPRARLVHIADGQVQLVVTRPSAKLLDGVRIAARFGHSLGDDEVLEVVQTVMEHLAEHAESARIDPAGVQMDARQHSA
eukprot:scaffold2727_cov385-Prasinococcus_capsulatus_cf.AAC.16